MGFKVNLNPEFTHLVPVMVPVDGGHREETLATRFRVLDDDALGEYDVNTTPGLRAMLDAVVVGFEDLLDDDDRPLACTAELRAHFLGLPYIRIGLYVAYRAATTKARLGN